MPDTTHFQGFVPGVRKLSAQDLERPVEQITYTGLPSADLEKSSFDSSNPTFQAVERALRRYGGVIFTGPPGTSKSHYAAEIADLITDGDDARQWLLQFHASYQYEDFIYGFVPKDDAEGFEPRPGPFLQACDAAVKNPDKRYVIVIDELSRVDAGRVFGEALTYVEKSKRGKSFSIASGEEWTVPENLVILATMNPYDKGVDEVDAAFERRFAKIRMDPKPDLLKERLDAQGIDPEVVRRVLGWFRRINEKATKNPAAAVGHAYFWEVADVDSLAELWEHQLQFLVERAFKLDKATGDEIEAGWKRIFVDAPATAPTDDTPTDDTPTDDAPTENVPEATSRTDSVPAGGEFSGPAATPAPPNDGAPEQT